MERASTSGGAGKDLRTARRHLCAMPIGAVLVCQRAELPSEILREPLSPSSTSITCWGRLHNASSVNEARKQSLLQFAPLPSKYFFSKSRLSYATSHPRTVHGPDTCSKMSHGSCIMHISGISCICTTGSTVGCGAVASLLRRLSHLLAARRCVYAHSFRPLHRPPRRVLWPLACSLSACADVCRIATGSPAP